jgi:hypothetical protein
LHKVEDMVGIDREEEGVAAEGVLPGITRIRISRTDDKVNHAKTFSLPLMEQSSSGLLDRK